jgi:hypothetical protein
VSFVSFASLVEHRRRRDVAPVWIKGRIGRLRRALLLPSVTNALVERSRLLQRTYSSDQAPTPKARRHPCGAVRPVLPRSRRVKPVQDRATANPTLPSRRRRGSQKRIEVTTLTSMTGKARRPSANLMWELGSGRLTSANWKRNPAVHAAIPSNSFTAEQRLFRLERIEQKK